MNDNFFNRQALDKLRSPEKLDTMIRIISPVGWMGTASVALLFLAIVLWSFYGSFTEKAEGRGLIVDSAGVVSIAHPAEGKITALYVQTGSTVHKGELIARMEQPEEAADTRMAQYGTELAVDDRDVRSRVYQYDAKRQTESVRENIYCDYDGVVDEVMAAEGALLSAGSFCTGSIVIEREPPIEKVFYKISQWLRSR